MAALHPLVVHFTIVLAIVGVAFRLVSLLGRPAFVGPAATTLLLLAAASSIVSVRSGVAAHGPVERAPGARPPVMEHEEWGERTQIVLLVLGAIELAGLALRRSPKVKLVHMLSAVVGLGAVYAVYQTGEHGGELVYAYAGGVGLRSGDPQDVRAPAARRLLPPGAGRPCRRPAEQAADLIAQAAARFPVGPRGPDARRRIAASRPQESRGRHRRPDGAPAAGDNRFMHFRKAGLLADAYEAAGRKADAIAALESTLKVFPNPRLQQRLDALKR